MRDQADVSTLFSWDDVALRLNSYPCHYSMAFAFSALLFPPSIGLPYGWLAIAGKGAGFPCST